jgi:hypothetical protein
MNGNFESSEMHDFWRELLQPGSIMPLSRAQELVNHIYKEHVIDTRLPFHKRFFHEICPLVTIASYIGDEAIGVVVSPRSNRYDGLIVLSDGRHQIVELTAAVDGHNDSLIKELLEKRGSAPVYQKIEHTGVRQQRSFGLNNSEAICMVKRDNELLHRMQKRLQKKKQIATTNHLYIGAWLGIVFDEWPPNNDRERWDYLSTRLIEGNSYHPFERLFCIGMHRSYLFDSRRLINEQI